MNPDRKRGIEWPKPGMSIFGAFSGGFLTESRLQQLQKDTSRQKEESTIPNQGNTPEPKKPS